MRDFNNEYMHMIEYGVHELLMTKYITDIASTNGFVDANGLPSFRHGDKVMFRFRDKFVALVKMGRDISKGANIIVSHIDSPRLDVIVGNPLIEEEDGVFLKAVPYGGIIMQSWLDIPLALFGRVHTRNGDILINTKNDGYLFTITSLLPHLDGFEEMRELKPDKLLVRIGNDKKDNVLEIIKDKYGIDELDLELSDLSFVPANSPVELGFDKATIGGYGHDDRACAYAALRALIETPNETERTQIAIFASYEETGSSQTTGCQSEYVDDIFLELTGDIRLARRAIRESFVISADVCSGYESRYKSHFEECAIAVVGKGVGIVPYLGKKRGNDTEFEFRNKIKQLALDNDIKYSVEITKVSEGGGGTVSTFFATRGCHVIDVGIPVLAMHLPQEVISKFDLFETYRIYKVFFEQLLE